MDSYLHVKFTLRQRINGTLANADAAIVLPALSGAAGAEYHLRAVAVHRQSPVHSGSAGHYVAYVRDGPDGGRWYLANDTYVTPCEVPTEWPCLLFLSRAARADVVCPPQSVDQADAALLADSATRT